VFVTLISIATSIVVTVIAVFVSPLTSAVREEIFPIAVTICVIVSTLVAFPIACQVHGRGLRLGRTVQMLEAAHAELARRARIDPLTGLLNRDAFMADMTRHRQGGNAGAVLMIDADHFKSVNDNFGHQAGDEALCLIGEVIRQSVRTLDLAARIGGEEFLVFLPEAGTDLPMVIAERIRAGVSDLSQRNGARPHHRLTVSIGVVMQTGCMSDHDIVAAADRNMYEAKHAGRNRVVRSIGPDAPRIASVA
jgi:diguanylate cyclase (GGDEF)-like protein